MIPALLSLLNRLTPARAEKLDQLENLDQAISSRAAASTALSTVQWTNTRAGYLDRLDAEISSRAAASTALSTVQWTNTRAGYLDQIPTLTRIKTIRRGLLTFASNTTTVTATLSPSVDASKSIIYNLGTGIMVGTIPLSTNPSDVLAYLELVNDTTVRATKYGTTNRLTVSWQIVEFY